MDFSDDGYEGGDLNFTFTRKFSEHERRVISVYLTKDEVLSVLKSGKIKKDLELEHFPPAKKEGIQAFFELIVGRMLILAEMAYIDYLEKKMEMQLIPIIQDFCDNENS